MSDAGDAGARLWAFDRCRGYELPGHRMLVRNSRSGRQALLTPEVFSTLEACSYFRTLDDHADLLCAQVIELEDQQSEVRRVLESVRNDGLLIAADIFALDLAPNPAARPSLDKPVVAVITWERPEALERCLASLAEHCDLDNAAEVLVIDDSRSSSVQDSNRASTERFATGTRTPVRYIGAREQRELIESLVREAPGLEAPIRFLVDRDQWTDHWTSGLARTLALLLSVDRRLLLLDDDILCQVFEPPRRRSGPSFAEQPREARVYAGNDDWQEYRAQHGTDPMLRHLSWLGATLPDALGALGLGLEPGAFAGAPRTFVEGLSRNSRVLVTECGSFGDPGTPRLEWITWLDADSLDALLQSEDTVSLALGVRNYWSGRSRPTFLCHGTISQFTGLDNRVPLPPYIPVMRGEDLLFGQMTHYLHPGSLAVDQPWAVPHLPIPTRSWTDANRRLGADKPFPGGDLLAPPDFGPEGPQGDLLQRIDRLARHYEDLATLSHESLTERFHHSLISARVDYFRRLMALRDRRPNAPKAWKSLIDDGLRRVEGSLLRDPAEQPTRGYPPKLQGEKLTAWWRNFWPRFGLALRAWPEIRLAARRLAK